MPASVPKNEVQLYAEKFCLSKPMSDLLKNACCLSFLLHMEELFRKRNQCNFAHDLYFVHQSGSVDRVLDWGSKGC